MKIENEILANPILRSVQEKFQNQQVKGLAKYGETVNPASYDIVGWLNHLQQELIDGTVYTEVLINQISEVVEENKKLRRDLSVEKGNRYSEKYVQEVESENKRFREALEFYANDELYDAELLRISNYRYLKNSYREPEIFNHKGEIARKALEELK